MPVILIGNYPQDKQESMERFALMLAAGFRRSNLKAEIWRPTVLLGRWAKSTNYGIGKWLGYIDKWVIFPIVLRWRLLDKSLQNPDLRFHICDHSNAPYLKYLPFNRSAITCHDVLAIRGGLGHADAYAPASGMGKFLQKWILYHLSRAKLLACVSHFTFNQLLELVPSQKHGEKDWRVIYNAFNADFRPIDSKEMEPLLRNTGIQPGTSFVLHVGSGLARKNRKLLLDMVAALGTQWTGYICYAGKPVDNDLIIHAKWLGLQERIISVVKPNHLTLRALYNACEAFIFPSFTEGFGWPVIEAQACGAPVIASNSQPMPEVSGGAALHADPTKPQEFADAFLSLQDEARRAELIRKGFTNCKRFDHDQIMSSYLMLHGLHPNKS